MTLRLYRDFNHCSMADLRRPGVISGAELPAKKKEYMG